MKHHISAVALVMLVLLAAAPMFAPTPKGWIAGGDDSMEVSDSDAAGALKFVAMGAGFHATNPMAAIYWNPANTAAGNYTLKGKFSLIKTGGFNEYYGLIFGGSELGGAGQN